MSEEGQANRAHDPIAMQPSAEPPEPPPVETPEQRLQQLLLERGLLAEITPPLRPEDYPRDRRPIPIEGKPISEFIIEERR
jgi:hypothetical protein